MFIWTIFTRKLRNSVRKESRAEIARNLIIFFPGTCGSWEFCEKPPDSIAAFEGGFVVLMIASCNDYNH